MRKRMIAAGLVLAVLVTVIAAGLSYAADMPYFTAANNTLLPFKKSAMPIYYGGVWYVSSKSFEEFKIYASDSPELGVVHLYKGTKYVDFYEFENKSIDQDGRERTGVSARRHNGVYYLPLGVVCSYFDLQYDFIPYDPIPILHIKSNEAVNSGRLLNDKTFIGINKERMQEYANAYFAPPEVTEAAPSESGTDSPPTSPSPSPSSEPTPSPPPEPTYENVTVYLSFYNVTEGYAVEILSALATPGYRGCFFVSAGDILENPELIRRIAGSGHSLGIWLESGGFEEYLEASRLLFEAAKVKTVLVSSGGDAELVKTEIEEHGLIYWDASRDLGAETRVYEDSVTGRFPTTAGMRYNLRLECADNISALLPGILSYLRKSFYRVVKITETTAPI